MFKKAIELKLRILAKMILNKYKPEIIGITGSVGKTSTKEAIYTVLKKKFKVRQSIKNYNNEIGVPLTIIGAGSPGKNIFGWLAVFFRAGRIIFSKKAKYPKILILEMGVDKPRDMKYLTSFIQPRIGVLTSIGSVHLEYFKSREQLAQEKIKLIKSVPADGWSIINYDSEQTRQAKDASQAKSITYGLEEDADLRASNLTFSFEQGGGIKSLLGISFKMHYGESITEVNIPSVLGYAVVYSALAAASVGFALGMDGEEIAAALKDYQAPKGRMNLVPGIKNTMIIDDSYNAEPQSTFAALGTLKQIQLEEGKRKFAVLGDMLELGSYSEEGHRDIGKYAYKCGIDKLVVVGEKARDIARGAEEAGMRIDDIFRFGRSEDAGYFIQDRLREGDLLLVKGSQGVRMEKIVKELMADPLMAKDLLVRQEKEWQPK